MNSYPRESKEFVAIDLIFEGAGYTTDVEFCITSRLERPVNFIPALTLDGKIGVMVDELAAGYYHVWARVNSDPEIPVIDCGVIRIT